MASSEDSDKGNDTKDESAASSGGLPAPLQLPNMDFSLPPVPGSSGDAPAASSSGQVDLPAHLQLPQFPDLGNVGAPQAESADSSHAPPPMPPGFQSAGGPPAPPPTRRSSRAKGPPAAPPPRRPAQPSVDLSLPDFGAPQKKRKLTLISQSVPSEMLRDGTRTSVFPVIMGIVVVAAIVVGVMAREPLMAVLHPKPVEAPKPPPPTPEQLAKVAFTDGVKEYANKDFPKAIAGFEQALQLDPKLADAHRSLGIVYATMHEQAKAVDHYRSYLELQPKAADAAEVQKIVDDYAKAQQAQPASAAAPEAAAPAEKPGKKAKGKKKGKR